LRSPSKYWGRVIQSEAVATPVDPVAGSFRTIFEREFGYVVRVLRHLGVSPGDLEDVAHDVFLHVYRHFNDYDPSRPLRPWLFGFAFRVARDFRARACNRQHFTRELPELPDLRPGADVIVLRRQMQELALLALDALDADERAVFVGIEIDEVDVPDLAAALGIPLNTAYSRLRRARAKFETAARLLVAKEPP
jgi:RNA polymerase sigma-70 factor (ECF subfamily)